MLLYDIYIGFLQLQMVMAVDASHKCKKSKVAMSLLRLIICGSQAWECKYFLLMDLMEA
jgi:hypothetical protein